MSLDLIGPASDNTVTTRPARSISRGTADTWFKDCSSPDANDGAALGADFFNDMLAQMRVAMRSSGIVLDNADDMLWRAMQSIGLRFGVDSGAAGHLTVAFSPPVASLYAGLAVLVQADSDCPGATDFTPNGLTTKSVTWPDGTALSTGDYKSSCVMLLVYDGAKWQLLFKLNNTASGGASAGFVPGCLYQWPTETPPTGTLECDGSAISRSTYARLFGIIGTNYGVGNGTTTFNLPDYRGEFLRSWDHGKGSDPSAASRTNRGDTTTGDHVGTKEVAAVKSSDLGSPAATLTDVLGSDGGSHSGGLSYDAPNAGDGSPHPAVTFGNIGTPSGDITGTMSFTGGGAETRPRNVNVLTVIAY